MAMSPIGLRAKNHCAGDGQQQFSSQSEWQPTNRKMDPPLAFQTHLGENINLGHRSWWDIESIYQVLIYADDLNLLGDNTSTINKNTEALIVANEEAGLGVNRENYVHIDVLLLECTFLLLFNE
jgi:hypothetical protein